MFSVAAVSAEPPSATAESHLEEPSEKKCVSSGFAPKSVETRRSPTYLARQINTAGLQLAAVMITRTRIIRRFIRVKFTLFRCTSAKLIFSCCGSIAAPRIKLGHYDQVPVKNNERRRGHRPRHKDQVRETQRAPPRATAWSPRPTTCAAPRATAGNNDQVPSMHNERHFGQRPKWIETVQSIIITGKSSRQAGRFGCLGHAVHVGSALRP